MKMQIIATSAVRAGFAESVLTADGGKGHSSIRVDGFVTSTEFGWRGVGEGSSGIEGDNEGEMVQ